MHTEMMELPLKEKNLNLESRGFLIFDNGFFFLLLLNQLKGNLMFD